MVSFGFLKGWVSEDFKSRNFSVYGQWIGILGMILCFTTGISTLIAEILHPKVFVWAILAILFGICILFMEVKWLFKCFRTPEKFENSIRLINGNYQRFGVYLVASIPMFVSAHFKGTSLIATGVILLMAALCFLTAGVMHHDYASSKTLGGGGVGNMIL